MALATPCGSVIPTIDECRGNLSAVRKVWLNLVPITNGAVLCDENGPVGEIIVRPVYGLTEMRSLIRSNVSFGTTFLATNSPFTR